MGGSLGEPEPAPAARLVAAAARLYRRRSHETVGVTEIAAMARVQRGSFYYYFPSKHSLTLAVLEAEWNTHRDRVFAPAFGIDATVAERFDEFARLLHRLHADMRRESEAAVGCPFANLGYELGHDPEIRAGVALVFDRMAGYFRRALGEGLARRELVGVRQDQLARQDLIYLQGLLAVSRVTDDIDIIAEMSSGFPHGRLA